MHLKILPKFGDTVYYEFNQEATTSSDKITDFNTWKTSEMVVYFLCADSKNQHETGKPYKWVNKLNLRFEPYDAGDQKKIKLEASVNDAKIKYTTDGSEPKDNGAVYVDDFILPKDTRFVLAIAVKDGIYSDRLQIPISWDKPEGLKIDKTKPLSYQKRALFKTNNNKTTYEEIELFKKYGVTLAEVFLNYTFQMNGKEYWSSVTFDSNFKLTVEQITAQITFMRESIQTDGDFETAIDIGAINFSSGQVFEDWMADKQMQLINLKQEEIIQ